METRVNQELLLIKYKQYQEKKKEAIADTIAKVESQTGSLPSALKEDISIFVTARVEKDLLEAKAAIIDDCVIEIFDEDTVFPREDA